MTWCHHQKIFPNAEIIHRSWKTHVKNLLVLRRNLSYILIMTKLVTLRAFFNTFIYNDPKFMSVPSFHLIFSNASLTKFY